MGELHATFVDSSPGGGRALSLVALLVAQPLAQPLALLVGQPVAQPLALLVALPVALLVGQAVACWWWLVVGGVGMERDGTPCGGAVPRVLLCCGGVLLSHNLSVAVPLALPGLASRFGMEAGRFPGAMTTTRLVFNTVPHAVWWGCGLIVVCIVVAAVLLLFFVHPNVGWVLV